MRLILSLACFCIAHAQVVPGKVLPNFPQSWDIRKSTGMMVCNSSGPVAPSFAKKFNLVDLDWNGGKNVWSATKPMSAGVCLSMQGFLLLDTLNAFFFIRQGFLATRTV